MERKETDYTQIIPTALRHAALGKLAEIYAILEDPELDDPACMQKIEAIVMAYHRRLGVHSTRHWEQD